MPKRGEKMSNETKIGQLVIDLQVKTQALEKGLETAQKKLKEIEEQNEEVKSSNKGLESSYLALSAVAVAALAKIWLPLQGHWQQNRKSSILTNLPVHWILSGQWKSCRL